MKFKRFPTNPKPDDAPDLLYAWETARWRFEICDNPNGPYLREVWIGDAGEHVHPGVDPAVSEILRLLDDAYDPSPKPLDDWHEDDGPALWWRFPVNEPPYVGGPLDTEWPGYHTHWTPMPPEPAEPGGAS